MDLGISGKKALVCASSKGLGRGCAIALAEAGVDLVLNARGADVLEQTAEDIRSRYNVHVETVACDITTEEGREKVLAVAGTPDILVNNAGIFPKIKQLHKKLEHPNIVKLYDVIYDYDNHTIYLIMEHCDGDFTTFQKRRAIKEKFIQRYMRQFRDGLKYLIDNKIFHRDLKPHNILIKNNIIKISDFGLAKEVSNITNKNVLKHTYCGSPMYMAPEMINYQKYDTRSDLWSIGVVIYEMITGTPPFHVKDFTQLKNKMTEKIVLPDKYKNLIFF